MYENNIQSVLIEGGTTTLQTFINEGLWDEARIFNGNVKFQDGIKAPKLIGENFSRFDIMDDQLNIIRNYD